jgi:hypothetical protein
MSNTYLKDPFALEDEKEDDCPNPSEYLAYELHEAVQRGDVERVKQLLAQTDISSQVFFSVFD